MLRHSKAMKTTQITVGKTYCNRGEGRTFRTVLSIGDEHRPKVYFSRDGSTPEGVPGVLFEQRASKGQGKGKVETRTLYLNSFAAWAKCEAQAPY